MPIAINVAGPHLIQWKAATSGATYADLGRGDNNDLFRIETTHKYADISTNEFGDMPAESVLTGITATLHMSFASWDIDEYTKLQARVTGRSATSNTTYFPVIGGLVGAGNATAANDYTVSFKLVPAITGRRGVEVTRVRLLTANVQDFGNRATRLVVSAEVLPDIDGVGTNPLFTFTTT